MPLSHAVAWIDHHKAQIHQFDADHARAETVKEHKHYTRQHGAAVRSEHEFFSDLCDALADIPEVLIAGSHTAQADFRRYVEKHRPSLSGHLVGWETVDHPTDGQLLALARTFFARFDHMKGPDVRS